MASRKITQAVAIVNESLSSLEKKLSKVYTKAELKEIGTELELVRKAYLMLKFRLVNSKAFALKSSDIDLL